MSMSVFGFDSVYQLIQIISLFGQILIWDLILMAHRVETTHSETVKCKSSCRILRRYPCSLSYVLASFAFKAH